jgi:uncharacterized protein (TIGR02145 family)
MTGYLGSSAIRMFIMFVIAAIAAVAAAIAILVTVTADERAYRQSQAGVTPDTAATITDSRDGKTYKAIKVGTQIWMAENLNYDDAKYSRCYDNNPDNCAKYGRLYDWETANNACPDGFHLPTNEEWNTLIDYVGGEKMGGKSLKSSKGWKRYSKSDYFDNQYGFTALPGGYGYMVESYGYIDVSFRDAGNCGLWWSAPKGRYMRIGKQSSSLANLFSVRCVKD